MMALGIQAAVVEDEDLLSMNAGNCKACISLRNPEDTAGDFVIVRVLIRGWN